MSDNGSFTDRLARQRGIVPTPQLTVVPEPQPESGPEDPQPDASPPASDSKETYQAFGIYPNNRRGGMFMLYSGRNALGGETIEAVPYTLCLKALTTSHQAITLFLSDGVLTLEGRNLTKLVEYVAEYRLKWVRLFEVNRHELPSEANDVCITKISQMPREKFSTGAPAPKEAQPATA